MNEKCMNLTKIKSIKDEFEHMFDGKELYAKLNDKNIISDLKIRYEDDEKVIFGVRRSQYKITIPKKVTPEITYLAGAIAGDGCFYYYQNPKKNYPNIRLAITGSEDTYLKLLNELFIKSFSVGGYIHKEKNKQSCYNLLVNHRIIWLYFRRVLELNKKKLNIPKEIINQKLFRFFLAGFFDTDGYFSNRGIFGTMISSRNQLFLNQLTGYSKELYNFEFSPVRINILKRNEKEFKRAYTRLKKKDSSRFISIVPLINKKYEWARAGSNRGSSLFRLLGKGGPKPPPS